MSSTSRNLIAVVIIVLIALGAWYWYQSIQSSWSSVGTTAGTDSTALPSGSDTSDQGLGQDMTSIGTNIQTVDSDSAAADTSVNEASSGSTQ